MVRRTLAKNINLGAISKMQISARLTDPENKLMITKRGMGLEGLNWEFEINRDILLCMK